MQKEYKTVFTHAITEFEEKKSRFIASVKPVKSEEEALEFIASLKSKYWDATHNVYAYYICGNSVIQRFSDDGEPSGTAGMPVLEVIKRMGVQDIVVVVSRYFGGTQLGASGLIRAYSKSASTGIEQAVIVVRLLCIEISVMIEYTLFGKVQSLIMNNGYNIKSVIYEQDVEIITYVPFDEVEGFFVLINEATSARSIIEEREKVYITLDSSGRMIGNEE